MKRFKLSFLMTALLSVLLACSAMAIRWPYDPPHETHPLGNHFGTFQNYGGSSYFHDGIDILEPALTPLYSVSDGWVTHITDSGGGLYCGIMIGDEKGTSDGWLYWHVESTTIAVEVGDSVWIGRYLGDIVYWPVANFHHVHFTKCHGVGFPWPWYEAIGNPLEECEPNTDYDIPEILNAYQDNLFSFAVNESSTYLEADELYGEVDIVCRVQDLVGHPDWQLNPYWMEYEIRGEYSSVPRTLSFIFTGPIPSDSYIYIPYRRDSRSPTEGNYDYRQYWFNVTNTDGDSVITMSDRAEAWNTDDFLPGNYWVQVWTADVYGNVVTDSMEVTVVNYSGTANAYIFPDDTLVYRGGTLGYTLFAHNGASSSLTFDGWTNLYLPNGEPWNKNPVLGPQEVTLDPGELRKRHVTHDIPGNAPLGSYRYSFRVGQHPGYIWDEAEFTFTVAEPGGWAGEGTAWMVREGGLP
jgi:hypothetical protein